MSLIWGVVDTQPTSAECAFAAMTESARGFPHDALVEAQVAPGVWMGCSPYVVRSSQSLSPNPLRLGEWWGVGDVLLDNRLDLTKDLEVGPNLSSDLGILLAAYQRWGQRAMARCRGDFAALFFHVPTGQAFACRDRCGIRPLYYRIHSRGLHFASDLSLLVTVPESPRHLDLVYARARLGGLPLFSHSQRTGLKGYRKVPAGHWLKWSHPTVSVGSYWTPPPPANLTLEQSALAIEDAVGKAVGRCMESDRPVYCHNSGGLDSSWIAVVAARQCTSFAGTLSWSPALEELAPVKNDERPRLQALGLPVQFQPTRLEDALQLALVDDLIYPQQTNMRERNGLVWAKNQGASLVLSGWGGDHFLSYTGYQVLNALLRKGHWNRWMREFYGMLKITPPAFWLQRLRQAWANRKPRPLPSYLQPDLREALTRLEIPVPASHWGDVPQTMLTSIREGGLPGRLEAWAAMGYREGCRHRYPLLDVDCLELALQIPPQHWIRDGIFRFPFRKAAGNWLPASICRALSKRDPAVQAWNRQIVSRFRQRYPALLKERAHAGLVVPEALSQSLGRQPMTPQDRLGLWLACLDSRTGWRHS